jgi:hypothetical protein
MLRGIPLLRKVWGSLTFVQKYYGYLDEGGFIRLSVIAGLIVKDMLYCFDFDKYVGLILKVGLVNGGQAVVGGHLKIDEEGFRLGCGGL